MSTPEFLAAAGLTLAMIGTGAAPAVAQDAAPVAPQAAKKKAEPPRGPAAEAARASGADAAVGTAADDADSPADASAAQPAPAPRAPAAPSASPPRPLGQTSRIQKATLPTKIDPKTGQTVVVISNLDLERLYGSSVVPVSTTARSAESGTGSPMRDADALLPMDQAAGGGGSGKPDAAARAAELDAEIKRLNDNARSMANPLLPPPKLTDAEKSALDGKNNKERLDLTRERIQELQQEKARLESSPSGEEPSGR
ncbi:MAG: hypothetical protein MUC67_00260 [Acidobacteria bacterium]|jgi:hypothetical protein|nr:hypothetical protein [Acidobacteriota bacterium]